MAQKGLIKENIIIFSLTDLGKTDIEISVAIKIHPRVVFFAD